MPVLACIRSRRQEESYIEFTQFNMSGIAAAAEEFSEKIIDSGNPDANSAEDSQESSESGDNKSNGQHTTLEERKAKMEELRKKMVCLLTIY